MEFSILTAKMIASIYITTGLAILIGNADLNSIVEDLRDSPAQRFIAGAIGMVIGVWMINYHNIWVFDWRVIITLISWGFFIGGAIVILLPQIFRIEFHLNDKFVGVFMTLFGLFLGYFGFGVFWGD